MTTKMGNQADCKASTLEKIGKHGADVFYSGELGMLYHPIPSQDRQII